jgi:hypothetical protein
MTATDAVKLAELWARRLITERQHAAGVMWRGDWLECQAELHARGFEHRRPKRMRLCGVKEDTFSMAAVARRRFHRANLALGPMRLVMARVVLEELSTATVALELGCEQRAVLPIVRLGLGELVQFYQLSAVDTAASPILQAG